jgi:hypothetical protein
MSVNNNENNKKLSIKPLGFCLYILRKIAHVEDDQSYLSVNNFCFINGLLQPLQETPLQYFQVMALQGMTMT